VRALLANAAWYASSLPARTRFLRNAPRAAEVQAAKLRALLSANADTEFGREHGFSHIRNLEEFRLRVPVRTYDDMRPWLYRTSDGVPNVLTREPILLFEPTGGSSGDWKAVPYTQSLQREFQDAIAVWIADLFHSHPGMMSGRSYWSITPPRPRPARTRGGTRIGFASDLEYLGGSARWIRHAIVPPVAGTFHDPEGFLDATALQLLACEDLTFISVWSPSFLLVLLERMRALLPKLGMQRARAIERSGTYWPRLRLVSCWTDAAAANIVPRIVREIPHVPIQGKGLLATEAFVTIPLHDAGGAVPAYASHVLEFRDDDCYDLTELEEGGTYDVIVTTGGGLYRYALGDRVRVTGRYGALPRLEFVGREQVCDLYGEKLHAIQVARVLDEALPGARFAMLAPECPDYVLFVESDDAVDAAAVERGLSQNVNYAHARAMGQLGPVGVFRIRRGGTESYLKRCVLEGQALGDIKPAALDMRNGWTHWFDGEMLTNSLLT